MGREVVWSTLVDDATSTSLATFALEETTRGVADTLRRMCAKLGIELIGANSAQSKGRVERGHGTHQDRLIKKMRLKKIATYEKANAFLTGSYLPQHNSKYAVTAREEADFHLAVGPGLGLKQIFCLEEERKVSNDWVVQYGKRWLQIEAEQKTRVGAGSTVVVREHRDGPLSLVQAGVVLRWRELGERPKAATPRIQRRAVTPPKPAPDHPWRKPIKAAQGR